MDKNSIDWIGPIPALITPFDADGNIDEAAFRRNVELCIGYGVTALLANGCTGEFWAQTNEERKRVVEICVDAAGGRLPVVAGTGAIRTPEVIELSEHAKGAGCAGVMILPPFFVKPSTSDIVAHYQAVSDAVDIPIMLYNIPANAVNALVPELVDQLADID
ncbi:MAG: dihydrodipicolinate synthase family protein, partial [Rhodospirillales bacterium]|nr:dihydrodipicolinate synthase family protein [Rhodospirillales bacterium]